MDQSSKEDTEKTFGFTILGLGPDPSRFSFHVILFFRQAHKAQSAHRGQPDSCKAKDKRFYCVRAIFSQESKENAGGLESLTQCNLNFPRRPGYLHEGSIIDKQRHTYATGGDNCIFSRVIRHRSGPDIIKNED
jgi:hypothetical protein